MNESSQIAVPEAFIALFCQPGSSRPTESREVITARHELCDDLAQTLTEPARATLLDHRVHESDVLDRVCQGLLVEGSVVTPSEAGWVTGRLAELLGWDMHLSRSAPLPE